MGGNTANESNMAMVGFLDRQGAAIVARWTQLLQLAMPQVFLAMPPALWSSRVSDVFSVLKRELREPEGLRYPVFGRRSGSPRVRDLGLRTIAASVEGELDLHEVESAYFLLEQAIVELADAHDGSLPAQALPLVAHFFKQLTVAMAMAVTARRTTALEEQIRERARQLQGLRQQADTFFSFVGHEIATSAAAMLAEHAIVRAGAAGGPEVSLRALDRADEHARLVRHFAEAVVEHVHLDAGTTPLRISPFGLAGLIEEVVIRLKPKWAPRHLTIIYDIAPELPPVAGDRARLGQVLLVLLAHAIRAMREGGTVTLRAYAEASEVVWDIEGEGAIAEQAALERFGSSLDDLREAGAPGLGLPTARLIVELHGGTITSEPGRHGMRVRVSLPRLPRPMRRLATQGDDRSP